MIVEVTAPIRIDLAGGTLDIYPLYLLLDGAVTVNAAINLECRVIVTPRDDGRIHIASLEAGQTLMAETLDALPTEGELGLVGRTVRFFKPNCGLNISTYSGAPRGSGLGASSALLTALGSALCQFNDRHMSKEALISRIAALEAQGIGVPTGKQDHYPVLHGGVNAVHFDVGDTYIERLVDDSNFTKTLENNLILSFTGESRLSGLTNWLMLKGYVEDLGDNRARMGEIKEIALKMREALLDKDLATMGKLLNREWECRKGLAEGVSTYRIEAMMTAAKEAGAVASKICGAGGGGCMITMASPAKHKKVVAALEGEGARIIPFKIAQRGLKISKKH